MEAAEAAAQLYTGTGVAKDFFPGGKLTITNDPSQGGDAEGHYVLRSVEYAVIDNADGSGGGGIDVNMACTAFPLDTQWREMPSHPPPVMAGVYTAKVIGPPGEEIYVDDLGRIKVWFPWDQHSDITPDNTLWVRVMQPWGGGNWGHQFIPRIGMEVIVAFLEGDVNRPLVVGSIYNNAMPPIFSASNKNKSGFRTRSTMGGGSDNYNELSFDDTMGSEVMFLHAEKDYKLEVENDQSVTVDNDRSVTVTNDETVEIKGKQTITVTKDRTLTVSEGNMATTVSQGNHSIKIDTGNHDMKVSTGNHSITVDTGDHAMKVSTGDHSTKVSMGNMSTEVSIGNLDTKVSLGNESLKVDLGSITHEAMQSITLKVGPSSITIDASGITLKGLMVQAKGEALVGLKGPLVQVNADGMLMMSGGVTMIN
jgi:type VI secretion system secreted protein VgrG